MLRCRKRNRVIVPRLASAFNYTKNTYPVFRFLCDVQGQGLKTVFKFSLASLLPGLHFYPRVTYQSCILQLAEWHLEEAELQPMRGMAPAEAFLLFSALVQRLNLPRFFAFTIHDHFLVLDATKAADVVFFLKAAGRNGPVVLREFPFLQETAVTDSQGHAFAPEYIASLYLNVPVYKAEPEEAYSKRTPVQLKDTKEWLYFKVYCHPLSSDLLLTSHLLPLLRQFVRNEMIRDWFWIRYSDPDYHLRVRMRPVKDNYANVLAVFTDCLNRLFADQLVRQFRTEVYRRELERYSAPLMLAVEDVFCASSVLVGRFLKHMRRESAEGVLVLKEAVWTTHVILDALGFEQRRLVVLCKAQFDQFFQEFGTPKHLKTNMEDVHKRLCPELTAGLYEQEQARRYRILRTPVLKVAADLAPGKVQPVSSEKLAADLVHMHLNRLFVYDQRYYEMITYYLLYRTICAVLYRNSEGVQP